MSTTPPDQESPDASPEPLLSIGMFARACLLSVKALRNYHEAGILVPARVDPSTGYRSYHVGQLTDAAVLRRLRDLDLPGVGVAISLCQGFLESRAGVA